MVTCVLQVAEMLAPAAITLRRPSGEVDLILSKKDFTVGSGRHPRKHAGMYSPPRRVCQSANTSPSGSNLPSPEDKGSSSSLPHSPEGTSPSSSPYGHRKTWFHKVTQLREDVDKISKRMKQPPKRSGLRGSVECLKTILSTKKEFDPTKRTLRVEKITSSRKSKQGSKDDMCIVSYDQPDHNFTTSLLMTNLEEGHFSAELSLDNLPTGNITIRICDYKLEITVDRHHDCGAHHKVSSPYYCGSISIPIYVMPQSLDVSLNEGRNVLELRGMTKGYQYQRLSASTSDLHSRTMDRRHRHSRVVAGLSRLFSLGKDGESTDNMASLAVEDTTTRERAYPR